MVMGIARWYGFPVPISEILRPLIQVVSIYTVPKSRNPFDQLIGGELVLKGFMFEVSSEKGQPKDLKFAGEMHLDHQSLELLRKRSTFFR